MKKRAPLWITGVGCLSAAGMGVEQTRQTFFSSSPNATGALTPSEEFAEKFDVACAKIQISELPTEVLLTAAQAKLPASSYLYPSNILALHATAEALQNAGIEIGELAEKRVGVCIGSTVGGTNYQPEFNTLYLLEKQPEASRVFEYFHNNTAQFLARHYGLTGPVQLINNACTSGADAIGIGTGWLERELCDIVICGGVETILPKMCLGFRSLRLYSPDVCRPFDRQRQGLVLGDGAGIVILERMQSHRKPMAQVLGYGLGSDAYHPTSPHPEARGLELAVTMSLEQAGLKPDAVDFINAHATATPHNDLAEGVWIKRNMPSAHVVATKGYTGHTLAAAGALEAIFSILSFESDLLPKSAGFIEMDPEIGLAPTTDLLAAKGDGFKYALSFSLGFGGANAALCLGRA